MEETGFLQDILECPVCLVSLTEQNKVLPCGHTFCIKCLGEILASQHELRCPECRILYKDIINLDELTSNILLIRLLEGLKQNMRTKNNRLAKTPTQTPMKQFGKLSVPHPQAPSLVQRQLMTNKTVLQQLSGVNSLGGPSPLVQQQYVSPRQLANTGASNGAHSMVYCNLPPSSSTQQYTHAPHQPPSTNRRAQINLESTLVKQQSLPHAPDNTLTGLLSQQKQQQTAPKAVKTPTSSLAPSTNAHQVTSHSLSSPNNLNNLNNSSSSVMGGHQQAPSTSGLMLNGNAKANCKPLSHHYATLPSSINLIAYQSLTNGSTPTSGNRQLPSTNTFQQALGVQLPSPQQCFTQYTLCRALYDFRVADVNDKNCLSFKKNDLITLIRRVDENWLEGSLDNNIGIFPITFVEFLPSMRPATRSLSQNSGPNASSCAIAALPAPPIYHHSRAHSSSTTTTAATNSGRLMGNLNHSRSNSINSGAANSGEVMHIRSNSISMINGNPNSDTAAKTANRSNSTQTNDLITNPKLIRIADQQHQFGQLDAAITSGGSPSSNSCDNLLDLTKSNQKPNLYIALYNYIPQKKDELQLKKNELYIVHEKCLDGWCKGCSVKTNESGVFPGNFLLPARNNATPQSSSTTYQNVVANRRSFGNLSTAEFDSADNLRGTSNGTSMASHLTKPKQLTSSMDNNLSDLNSTMTKMTLNGAQSAGHTTMSKSVEQLNQDNLTYENLMSQKNGAKKSGDGGSNTSSASTSPQWIQPKVAATRSVSKPKTLQPHKQHTGTSEPPYSLVLNTGDLSSELRIEITTNANNTTHVIKEVINTPIKKEDSKKSVNIIKMLTGKRSSSKIDKHKNFSCDNPLFEISPKN